MPQKGDWQTSPLALTRKQALLLRAMGFPLIMFLVCTNPCYMQVMRKLYSLGLFNVVFSGCISWTMSLRFLPAMVYASSSKQPFNVGGT